MSHAPCCFLVSPSSINTYLLLCLTYLLNRDDVRPLIPAFAVVASYGVAIAYVSADAAAKGFTCAKDSDSK